MAHDASQTRPERTRATHRPPMRGGAAMVSSGHQLATLAGLRILERGGNAVDAGVAAGICLGVVQSDMVNFGGVAPILIFPAATGRPVAINGLGTWPRAASAAYFREQFGGEIPPGVLRSLVPAAPDAWITALSHFGTIGFGEAAADAMALAEAGFPVHHFMAGHLADGAADLRRFPSNAAVYLPEGQPPRPGDLFQQPELAATLRRLADAEHKAASAGREAGLQAVRDEFYRGGIAEELADYMRREGGLLTREDLAGYRAQVEEPLGVDFLGHRVLTCGPWCQGPALLEALNLLAGFDLKALGHNSPRYAHTVLEAFKLVFADREAFLGDPAFVPVPLAGLLSPEYAAERRAAIDPQRAWPEMPPPGDPWKFQGGASGGTKGATAPAHGAPQPGPDANPETGERWDTSYAAVMDRWGNAFSATPSDTPLHSPIVPGLGIVCSGRGSQSWLDEGHPALVQGGKHPRLTPSPALVLRNGRPAIALGTPGGDVITQTIAQVLLNLLVFGMDAQEAVEAPRFATYNFPGSFWPHTYQPGLARAEQRIGAPVLEHLAALGNRVEPWQDWAWRAGGVCVVLRDPDTGLLQGGADPRRECVAFGS